MSESHCLLRYMKQIKYIYMSSHLSIRESFHLKQLCNIHTKTIHTAIFALKVKVHYKKSFVLKSTDHQLSVTSFLVPSIDPSTYSSKGILLQKCLISHINYVCICMYKIYIHTHILKSKLVNTNLRLMKHTFLRLKY